MDFKIFIDKELTNEVEDPINLGRLKAGETKQFSFYVLNTTVFPYQELKFDIEHKEVAVISAPEELNEKSSAKIILEWKPSIDIKRGLRASLKINGFQVIG